jgi:hypothetical protein
VGYESVYRKGTSDGVCWKTAPSRVIAP